MRSTLWKKALNLIKNIYKNPTANTTLVGKTFRLKSEMPILSIVLESWVSADTGWEDGKTLSYDMTKNRREEVLEREFTW